MQEFHVELGSRTCACANSRVRQLVPPVEAEELVHELAGVPPLDAEEFVHDLAEMTGLSQWYRQREEAAT